MAFVCTNRGSSAPGRDCRLPGGRGRRPVRTPRVGIEHLEEAIVLEIGHVVIAAEVLVHPDRGHDVAAVGRDCDMKPTRIGPGRLVAKGFPGDHVFVSNGRPRAQRR